MKETATEKITLKKPWNRVDLPVYSISSKGEDGSNMHIITYVTSISMQPKRFICGIFHGTQTLDNVESNGEFVLQLLAGNQYRLVDLLGKKSGKAIDKIKRLTNRNELAEWKGYPILKNCIAVILLKVIHSFDAGDHKAFLCDTIHYKNLHNGDALTLDDLRQRKLIRM